MKNKEQGITLTVLVTTIIVMLILVTVTVAIAMNGGIFGKSEEASFKTKVTEILDAVILKKGEKLSDNPRAKTFTITIASNSSELNGIDSNAIDISDELREEFKDKLFVDSRAEVHYIPEKFTTQEIRWLEDLGVTPKTRLLDKVIAVRDEINNNADTIYGNSPHSNQVNDIAKIIEKMNEKYPDVMIIHTFAYKNVITSSSTISTASFSSDPVLLIDFEEVDPHILNFESDSNRQYKILSIAANKGLSNDTVLTSDSDINAIITEAKNNNDWQVDDDATLENYKNLLALMSQFIFATEDEQVFIAFENLEDMTNTKQLMPKKEFDSNFDYELVNEKIFITKYKGASKDVVIPNSIYDTSGNVTTVIGVKSGAFGIVYPNFINNAVGSKISDFTSSSSTVAGVAQEAKEMLENDFGADFSQYNPFTQYTDGTSTSLADKHQYVGIPTIKLVLYATNGNTLSADKIQEALNTYNTSEYFAGMDMGGRRIRNSFLYG